MNEKKLLIKTLEEKWPHALGVAIGLLISNHKLIFPTQEILIDLTPTQTDSAQVSSSQKFVKNNLEQLNSANEFTPVVLTIKGKAFCSGTGFESSKDGKQYVLGIAHCFQIEGSELSKHIHNFRVSDIYTNDSAVIISNKVLESEGYSVENAEEYLNRNNVDISQSLKKFRSKTLAACNNTTSNTQLTSVNMNYAKTSSDKNQFWAGGSSGAGLFARDNEGKDCFYGVLKGFKLTNGKKVLDEIKQGTFNSKQVDVNYNFVSPGTSTDSKWVVKQSQPTLRPTTWTVDPEKIRKELAKKD